MTLMYGVGEGDPAVQPGAPGRAEGGQGGAGRRGVRRAVPGGVLQVQTRVACAWFQRLEISGNCLQVWIIGF